MKFTLKCRKKGSFTLSVDRPAVIAQTECQLTFASGAVAVAEGMEGCRVTRFGKMGEFVADYVVAQFGWEEYVEI